LTGPGIAETAADITPRWLSDALSQAGRAVDVATVSAERVGAGQVGATYRLTIDAASGAAPRHVIAKLAAENPAARGAVSEGYRNEVGFYRDIAPTVDVRAPACSYSAISDDATVFTLLLEDLAPARVGVQVDGCTVPQALAAVRNVAGLHAPRWNDPSLAEYGFLRRIDAEGAAFTAAILGDAMANFIARFDDRLSPDDVSVLREVAEVTETWLTTRIEPFAVIHGDYRLDNLMFHPDGTVAAVDWQTASVGPPLRDVAYLLGTSLDTDARRASEAEIVGAYFDVLLASGVAGYDATRCFDDYRIGQFQGPFITVLGCEYATAVRTPQADDMFHAMATRSCAAIRDLRSFDALRGV
jgi:hypothetical protein